MVSKRSFTLLLGAFAWVLLALPIEGRSIQAEPWTWVFAEGDEEAEELAQRMFALYQERSILRGRLVGETQLTEIPSGRAVFIGPIRDFDRPTWFSELVRVEGGGASLAGVNLIEPETGFFVQSADEQRLLYSGLSGAGFRQIFSVPTGRAAATVTFEGRVTHEGRYSEGALALEPVAALRALPTAAELEAQVSELPNAVKALSFIPVHAAAKESSASLSAGFVQRLQRLTEERCVLFFGEQHWNAGVNGVFMDTLDWLLRERGVSTLFLETSYSHSAHFQRYVGLADDADAETFWAESLRPLVLTQSTRDLLDRVRVWNREHVEARVQVACLDAEFDFNRTIRDALGDYFRALDEKSVPGLPASSSRSAVLEEVKRLRELMEALPVETEPHPWLSTSFVRHSLVNLEESVRAQGKSTRMADRQRSILRNITEFHGAAFSAQALGKGLVVFKEGGAHAWKNERRDDGAFWEAEYLQHHFAPTRSRVATLGAVALGYRMDAVASVGPATHRQWATQYHGYVSDFQWALRAGLANEEGLYLLGRSALEDVEKVALQKARASAESALLLPDGSAWSRFDAVIYVVGGAMEAPLFRR
ncbi:MAG: hypothetical protein AAGG01_15015 [Planctomycetota bacterium]